MAHAAERAQSLFISSGLVWRDAIILELFLNVSLGLLFVLCARERVRADGSFPMPPFLLVVMFVVAIQFPVAVYLYWAHPAWSWLYLFDPTGVPDLLLFLIVLVQCGVLVGAWYLGAFLLQIGKDRVVLYVITGSTFVLILLVVLFAGRLGSYGTYEDFTSGETATLLEVKLGYVLIALVLGVTAAASFVGMELVRNSRRVRVR